MAAPADEKNVLGLHSLKEMKKTVYLQGFCEKRQGFSEVAASGFIYTGTARKQHPHCFQKCLSYHALYPFIPNANSPEPKLKHPSLH